MKITDQDAIELQVSLEHEIKKGNFYVAYAPDTEPLSKDALNFFSTNYDAWEYCYENSTDRDIYEYTSTSSFIAILNESVVKSKEDQFDLTKDSIDPDRNPLYDKDGNAFTDALVEHMERQQSINSQLKTNIMNNENLQYLTDIIKYMGFGENLKADLEKNMGEGKADFQLHYQAEINKKPFEATLNFRKSDSTDMYFFNSYHASLERNNGEKTDQTFYLNKGKGITAKEGYNMLEGRSVFKELSTKEGQTYKAWVQLDLDNKDKHNNHEVKQFHENYGYDLKAAVSKFSIAELADSEKAKSLFRSLQKGNIQSVSIEKDGGVSKMFIEANPQYKTVNLYDTQMKRMQKEDLGQLQSVHQSQNKEVKQEQKEDIKQDPKKNVKQKPGDDMDVPKKEFT